MKEIVWVVGHSGVGKETFCRSLTDNPDEKLIKELGWTGLKIGMCVSSITLVPRGHQKEKEDDRNKIINELKAGQDLVDIILLKWQALDSQKNRVKTFGAEFPNSTTRALVLQADDRLVQERHLNRESTWTPDGGWKSLFSHENTVIEEALRDFSVVDYIDVNNGYKLVRELS